MASFAQGESKMNDPVAAHYITPGDGDGDGDGEEQVSLKGSPPGSEREEEGTMEDKKRPRTDRRFRTVVILLAVILATNFAVFVAVLSRGGRHPSTCQIGEQSKSASPSSSAANASNSTTQGPATTTSSPLPAAPNWQFAKCRAGSFLPEEDAVLLDAVHGSWPGSGICIAYNRPSFIDSATSYALSASFMHIKSGRYAFPGMIYNYVDDFNYDLIYLYFPSHSADCTSTVNGTYYINGRTTISGSGYKSETWNTLRALVFADKSTVEMTLNGEKLGDCPFRLPQAARGGVLVLNGYGNIFKFKDVIIEKL